MAKFITFNGQTIVHPGAVVKIDVSALAQVSAGASGIVCLIGEADGGQPNTASTPKVFSFTDPSSAKSIFKSGPLADAIPLAFDASNDPRLNAGCNKVIAIKTNQSTGATVTLKDDAEAANNTMSVTSRDFGSHTDDITFEVSVSSGDSNNNQVDISVVDTDGTIETFTGQAGKALMNLAYVGPDSPTVVASGATVASVSDAGGEHTIVLSAGITGAKQGNWLLCTSASDNRLLGQFRRINTVASATQIVTKKLFTSDAANTKLDPQAGDKFSVVREVVGPFNIDSVVADSNQIKLDMVPDATSKSTWLLADYTDLVDKDNGPNYVRISSGPGAGEIRKITAQSVASNILTLTLDEACAATSSSKVMFLNLSHGDADVGATATIAGTDGAANLLTVKVRPGWGENDITEGNAGGALVTDFTMTLGSAVSVKQIVNRIKNGSNFASGPVVTSGKGYLARVGSGRSEDLATSRLDFDSTNTGVDISADFNQLYTNTFGKNSSGAIVTISKKHRLLDNLEQIVDTINTSSGIVKAAKITTSGAKVGHGAPEMNNGPVPLTGGSAGTTSSTDILNAFDQALKVRHNTIVPLFSSDSSTLALSTVHQAALSHTQAGSGNGKNECDAILAIKLPAVNSVATLKGAQADLNNHNVALVYQQVQRLNALGESTLFDPHMLAVILAGMQGGSPVGEPLTYKYLRATDMDEPASLDPLDKSVSDDLLLSGILFAEEIPGKGFRVARNISTWTRDDNLAYTDRNVREVLNHISYELRTFIEDRFTGLKATPATAVSIKNSLVDKLQVFKDEDIIVDSTDSVTGKRINAYRNVRVTISGDIATIRLELFPVIGINYETISVFAQLPVISA